MYDQQKTNTSGSCPPGRCYKAAGSYHHRGCQNAWGQSKDIVNEKAMLSPDMAIRIAKATNTSPESWMNMQQKLTLWEAEQHLPENVIPFPSVHSEEAATLQM